MSLHYGLAGLDDNDFTDACATIMMAPGSLPSQQSPFDCHLLTVTVTVMNIAAATVAVIVSH